MNDIAAADNAAADNAAADTTAGELLVDTGDDAESPEGVIDAFWAYERALLANDLDELDRLFVRMCCGRPPFMRCWTNWTG